MQYRVEFFKNTEVLVAATMLCVSEQKSNNVLFLKHQTFCKLLNSSTKDYVIHMFAGYQNNVWHTNDPLDLFKYLIRLRKSSEYVGLLAMLDNIIGDIKNDAKKANELGQDVAYLCKCYARNDDPTQTYSIYSGTMLQALGFADIEPRDLLFEINMQRYIARFSSENISSYTDIVNKLTFLCKSKECAAYYCSCFVCLLLQYVYDTHVKYTANWADFINEINTDRATLKGGFSRQCCLNF